MTLAQPRWLDAVTVTALSALLLAGCLQTSSEMTGRLVAVEEQARAVEQRAAELEGELKKLRERVDEVAFDLFLAKVQLDQNKTATFDPSNPRGFQRVESNNGTFLVSVEDVRPYLDGHRVTLHVGNPQQATFGGFKMKVGWARRMPSSTKGAQTSQEAWKAFHESKQEKEFSFTETLRPGTWNRISFVVAPAKAEEFGYLELSMTTNQVVMTIR